MPTTLAISKEAMTQEELRRDFLLVSLSKVSLIDKGVKTQLRTGAILEANPKIAQEAAAQTGAIRAITMEGTAIQTKNTKNLMAREETQNTRTTELSR